MWGATLKKIEAELSSMGKAWRDVEIVLITHRHGDHIGNLKRVKELTNARSRAGHEFKNTRLVDFMLTKKYVSTGS